MDFLGDLDRRTGYKYTSENVFNVLVQRFYTRLFDCSPDERPVQVIAFFFTLIIIRFICISTIIMCSIRLALYLPPPFVAFVACPPWPDQDGSMTASSCRRTAAAAVAAATWSGTTLAAIRRTMRSPPGDRIRSAVWMAAARPAAAAAA